MGSYHSGYFVNVVAHRVVRLTESWIEADDRVEIHFDGRISSIEVDVPKETPKS
jgi:hypothetical protein